MATERKRGLRGLLNRKDKAASAPAKAATPRTPPPPTSPPAGSAAKPAAIKPATKPATKPAPASVPRPAKKVVPVNKVVPAKKVAPVKKAAPVKKVTAPVKKAAPVKKVAPVKKAATKAARGTTGGTSHSHPPLIDPPAAALTTPTKATRAPTKAPVKATVKATVSANSPLTGDDAWTKKELADIRKELGVQAKDLQGEIDEAELQNAALQRDAGSEGTGDEADAGTKTFEREHEMSLANNSRDLLVQVERALARLDAGTYGRCENCGNPIPKARLQALPAATLDVACKQREERR